MLDGIQTGLHDDTPKQTKSEYIKELEQETFDLIPIHRAAM